MVHAANLTPALGHQVLGIPGLSCGARLPPATTGSESPNRLSQETGLIHVRALTVLRGCEPDFRSKKARLRVWGLGFIVKGLGLRAKGLSLACGYSTYGEEHLIAQLLYGRS